MKVLTAQDYIINDPFYDNCKNTNNDNIPLITYLADSACASLEEETEIWDDLGTIINNTLFHYLGSSALINEGRLSEKMRKKGRIGIRNEREAYHRFFPLSIIFLRSLSLLLSSARECRRTTSFAYINYAAAVPIISRL